MKFYRIVLILSMALFLMGCEKKQADQKVISMAFQSAEGTTQYKGGEYLQKLLAEKSGGKLQLRMYPSGQMGSDREIIESGQFGDISIVSCSNSPLVTFFPEFAVFDVPMMFSGYPPEEIVKIFRNSSFRDQLNEVCRKKGMELISLNCNHLYREMSSNEKIETMDDFKKIRIRTMDNKYHMAFWKSLGASPTPIAFPELYLSLQQGLVNAQENPYEVLIYTGIHEQPKYIINTDHCLFVTVMLMNQEQYNQLTEEEKQILKESILEYEEYINQLTNEEINNQLEQLTQKYHMEVLALPESVRTEMQKRAKPIYDMIGQDIGKQWLETLEQELQTIKGGTDGK